MDVALFGLGRRPFRPAPDPDLYFPAAAHEAAAAALRAGFDAADGIALLDGGPGTGKTLVALRLLDALAPDAAPVFVPSARFARPAELHQAILFDLGKPYQGLGETELRLAVTEHLLGVLAARRRLVLVLDEAHHLGPDVLEEVRLLDNFDARGTKAAFTVLVGLPDLRTRLTAPPLAAVAQRVCCRPRLDPLGREESAAYLRHGIERCGGRPDEAATDEAIELLAAHSGGVPRVLNQLATAAFAVAAEAGQGCVDAEAAYEALTRAGVAVDEPAGAAGPAYPAGAARSLSGEPREAGDVGGPDGSGSPKQKGKRRRAA
jgi:type II secretory pathway predicted ATPase ExeA